MKDYETEVERKAYSMGVIARINGMCAIDNPYTINNKDVLHLAWIRGFNERGSIKKWGNKIGGI